VYVSRTLHVSDGKRGSLSAVKKYPRKDVSVALATGYFLPD